MTTCLASSKLRTHFVFSETLVFIWVLTASHGFVGVGMASVIVDYFTDVLNYDMRKAAIISNMVDCALSILVIVPHRSDSYVGQFNVIIFYTGASVTGLMLLWVCEVSAVSREFFPLFSLAFLLTVLGKSGRTSTLSEFFEYQFMEKVGKQTREMNPQDNQQRNIVRLNVWFYSANIVGACMTAFLPADITWKDIFKISAILMGSGLLVFYSGCFFYSFKKPKTSLSKQSSENVRFLRKILCRTQLFLKSSSNSNNLNGNPGMGREAEEVKQVISVTLLLLTILPYSLALPAATGFFVQQANSMEFNFNVSAFFVMSYGMRCVVKWLFWWSGLERQSITKVRIFCGMVCSMLCCLTAWRVELRRLWLSNLDKETNGILLIPQFLLLGLAEGLIEDGYAVFFCNHVPESKWSFRELVTEFIHGIGSLLTVALTLIFSRLGWFQESLNDSRLDIYYLMLAILHLVFLFIYGYYSRNKAFREPYPNNQELRTTESGDMLTGPQEEEHAT